MKIHANATLTIRQRQEIRRLFLCGASIRDLAAQFHVNPTTVRRWAHRDDPHDRSCAPKKPRTTITEEYRQAVLAYRAEHPTHGASRIAWALEAPFPQAHRGTVQRILQDAQATKRAERKPGEHPPLPVGRHRVQVDIQQLPAIEEGSGFEQLGIQHGLCRAYAPWRNESGNRGRRRSGGGPSARPPLPLATFTLPNESERRR
jgi:hypothetical protein